MAFHPLFRLGAIPGSGTIVVGGPGSLLAFWLGGGGAVPGGGGEGPKTGPRSLLAFWVGGAGAIPGTGIVPPTAIDVDGKRRRRRGDEELTEAEIQWMFRKIAELKKAKSEREKERLAKELEIALAQAARDDEAAEVISETIAERQPKRRDYAAALRNVSLLTTIADRLDELLHKQSILEWQAADEDDIEVLMLTIQ